MLNSPTVLDRQQGNMTTGNACLEEMEALELQAGSKLQGLVSLEAGDANKGLVLGSCKEGTWQDKVEDQGQEMPQTKTLPHREMWASHQKQRQAAGKASLQQNSICTLTAKKSMSMDVKC